MFPTVALISLTFLAIAHAQQVGTQTAENHPALSVQSCAAGGSCTSVSGSVVLDSNWRWLHTTSGYTNCYTGNTWDTSLCPDPVTCAANCALDGADYQGTYGITTSGNELSLQFVTGANIGSRVYLMADDSHYRMFHLKNQEFTFDVDVSNLPCGLNGALYFVEMDEDGGISRFSGNKAGAKYGTGYCDTQCPHDIKFINGEVSTPLYILKKENPLCSTLCLNPNDRPMSSTGHPLVTTRTPEPVNTVHAVTRWISGKPTPKLQPLLLTYVASLVKSAARVPTVVTATKGTTVSATRTAVTSTHGVWATKPSSVPD